MQELERRLRIAEISANVQGVNADNFIKFCNTLEGWVAPVDDDDPLRIGVQSPCNGNCGMNYCDENGCLGKKEVVGSPAPIEIDWSRPQLLVNNDGLVIRYSGGGVNSFGFGGVVVDPGMTSHMVGAANRWNPDVFHYHGEIPQEPDTQKTFSILDMSKCFEESRLTHSMAGFKHDKFSDYLKWVEIPQEQQEEPKATGMNFIEACLVAKNSKAKICRPIFDEGSYMYYEGYELRYWGMIADDIAIEDFLATDWQIIEP